MMTQEALFRSIPQGTKVRFRADMIVDDGGEKKMIPADDIGEITDIQSGIYTTFNVDDDQLQVSFEYEDAGYHLEILGE